MPKIHHLSDLLVSQIAAGEVVQRPSSVVKELLENSLDAGAREIVVELESGGKSRLLITDDGHGMGRDDSLLAFDRHATSKIASFEDLEKVGTLGFRGEALASIAAVAKVELATAEAPGEGHRVRIEGGRVMFAEPISRPRGTAIEVRSLFYNVPARRKFLKEPATELRRCLEVVQGYALARPDVRFSVLHEGRHLLDALTAGTGLAASGGPRERIGQIFGAEFASHLAEIPPVPGDGLRPGEHITGFLGAPNTSRTRRTFVFVNRRLLRDRSIHATFYRAVREEWHSEDYPALFLFLDLPPEDVDVNVHPQKAEVRFRDLSFLERLSDALRAGLVAARGEEPAPLRQPHLERMAPLAWQGLGERTFPPPQPSPSSAPPGMEGKSDRSEAGEAPSWVQSRSGFSGVAEPAPPPWGGSPGGWIATPSYTPIERPIVPLSGRRGEARPFRLLGQYKGTLILLEGPDGLYLIDQHVAHERLLYERFRRAMTAEAPPVQHLLTPVLLDLGPTERLRLTELAPALEECGFAVAPLSGNTLALTAVPAPVSADEAEALLASLASEDGEGTVEALRLRLLEALAASSACKAAVKMHHPLSAPEMEALVAELFQAEQPYACPHGRPIVLQMTDSDLERRFGRRG